MNPSSTNIENNCYNKAECETIFQYILLYNNLFGTNERSNICNGCAGRRASVLSKVALFAMTFRVIHFSCLLFAFNALNNNFCFSALSPISDG